MTTANVTSDNMPDCVCRLWRQRSLQTSTHLAEAGSGYTSASGTAVGMAAALPCAVRASSVTGAGLQPLKVYTIAPSPPLTPSLFHHVRIGRYGLAGQ